MAHRCSECYHRIQRTRVQWIASISVTTILTAFLTFLITCNTSLSEIVSRVNSFKPRLTSLSIQSPAFEYIEHTTTHPSKHAWHYDLYTYEPSQSSDEAWDDLQQVRGVWVTPEEAKELGISGLSAGNGTTATLLGVMHNLHCIRVLRQILHPDYYYPDRTEESYQALIVHSGHCLEAMRQSIMCYPDLTPRAVFWEDEERTNIGVNPNVKQKCVDWQSLVNWEHQRSYNLVDLWEANPA